MCQSVGSMERVCEGGVETYTPRGHVVGMLDRDQRTAKVPTYQKHTECQNFSSSSPSSSSTVDSASTVEQVCRGKVHTWNSRGWKSRVRDTAQRLKQVLVVSTCLFSIVSIPGSLSAPYAMEDRMKSDQKWILDNCLHIEQTPIDNPDQNTLWPLLDTIIDQANVALSVAIAFKTNYTDAKQLNVSQYKDWRYEFLPQIPKKLDEPLPDDFHLNINLKDALIDTYERLQRVAVGLEEVTWGEKDNPSDHQQRNFVNEFSAAEVNVRNLLFEVGYVICELGYKSSMKPDITRSVMPSDLRNMANVTSRYPRDWIIYREYINNLEYIIELFKKLKY